MRKTMFLFALVGIFILSAVQAVFAGDSTPNLGLFTDMILADMPSRDPKNFSAALGSFEITSGIVKDTEVTFDSERLIVGTAPKDTFVSVEVYRWDETDNKFKPSSSYELTVGASGIFSQNIELELGENYVLITASRAGHTFALPRCINRKSADIKRELESGIVLPGTTYP